MPKFDSTGPEGFGPRTGRGFGPCGSGRGIGRGRGFGAGLCRFFGYQPRISEDQEVEMLNEESEILEKDLQEIKKRLEELKGKK